MSLTPGTRLGSYDVIALIGAGGMGEVYRARDTQLNRDVAIKVLSGAVVSDADRLARFRREAQVLASLNHPNIGQIYGVENNALVLELVEGPTLDERMALGPMPLADALPIARQIALALEAAHEQGIVHRDLKPANIKVRDDGTVKVLDFGLAKALAGSDASGSDLANSPTLTARATQLGVILGTAAYMSPEQARGKAVDRRADIWAFGVVLYEMLAGRRAFQGSEASDVLASVLKDTIPLGALPADTPTSIRRLLRRCLEKDRANRLDSMTAARLEIGDASLVPGADEAGAQTPAGAAPRARASVAAMTTFGVAALAAGLLAGWAIFRSPTPATTGGQTVRFPVPLPAGASLTGVAVRGAGDVVIYESDRLYVRGLSDPEARPLAGTEGARNLFVSTDGRWVGFYAGDKIRKIAVAGGDPLTIADVSTDTPGGAWGPDNTIIYTTGWNAPLVSVSADGGDKPRPLSTLNAAGGELGHWWPELLPDGKTVLFTVWMAASGINDSRIAALDVATGTHRVLMPGSGAKYLASGHLLYFHAGTYYVVPFDLTNLRATGEPAKVLPDAKPLDPLGTRNKPVAVSANGTLVYLTGAIHPERELAWVTPAGVVQPIGVPARRYSHSDLSPDGRRLASARIEGGSYGLWLTDLSRLSEEKLELAGANFDPIWSKTGDFLAFTSMRGGHFDVFTLRPGENAKALITDPFDQSPNAISTDGKTLLLTEYFSDGSASLAAADIDRPQDRKRLPGNAGNVDGARLSPDDQWIAVAASPSGRRDVVVQPFKTPGPVVRVSSRGGSYPVWSKTGSKLYYQRDEELVAVTYTVAGGRFSIEREDTIARLGPFVLAGIAPDGRFLIAKARPGQAGQLQVVVNWFQELGGR